MEGWCNEWNKQKYTSDKNNYNTIYLPYFVIIFMQLDLLSFFFLFIFYFLFFKVTLNIWMTSLRTEQTCFVLHTFFYSEYFICPLGQPLPAKKCHESVRKKNQIHSVCEFIQFVKFTNIFISLFFVLCNETRYGRTLQSLYCPIEWMDYKYWPIGAQHVEYKWQVEAVGLRGLLLLALLLLLLALL